MRPSSNRSRSARSAARGCPPDRNGQLAVLAQWRRKAPSALEAGGGVAEVSLFGLGEVDRPVEHHAAHAIGELLRVDRPDDGAIRVAEVVELLVAQRRPEPVEVAGDVAAPDPCEPRAVLGDASLDEVDVAFGTVVERAQLGIGCWSRISRVERVGDLVADAIDRAGSTRAGGRSSRGRSGLESGGEDRPRNCATSRRPGRPGRRS